MKILLGALTAVTLLVGVAAVQPAQAQNCWWNGYGWQCWRGHDHHGWWRHHHHNHWNRHHDWR